MLTAESMKTSKLKDHWKKSFSGCRKWYWILQTKGSCVTWIHRATLSSPTQVGLEQKKPHTIEEEFTSCLVDAVNSVLGEQHVKKINKISLSNNTIKSRIEDIEQEYFGHDSQWNKIQSFLCTTGEKVDRCCLLFRATYVCWLCKRRWLERRIVVLRIIEPYYTWRRYVSNSSKFCWWKGLAVNEIDRLTGGAPSILSVRFGFIFIVMFWQ